MHVKLALEDDDQDQTTPQTTSTSSPNPPMSMSAGSGSQQNLNSIYSSNSNMGSVGPPGPPTSSFRDRPHMSLNLGSSSFASGPQSGAAGPPGSMGQAPRMPPQMPQRPGQQGPMEPQPQPKMTSASQPSSPTRTNYNPASTSATAANIARNIFRQVSQSTTNLVQQTVAGVSGVSSGKGKVLLVIDDQHTDWSKYFRGRKIHNEFDIRVEQAEFSEISMTAFSDRGTMVDVEVNRGGTKTARSFRPDFVLVRQPIRDGSRDYRHLLLALLYGNVPSVNSLESLASFLDKPLIFSQLIEIQQRLGRNNFPLIPQSYYPTHKEMQTISSFPVVLKIGHAHAGLGKTRVTSAQEMQDIASIVGSCGAYCTAEPFVDSKYDLHLQKIGPSYKAYMRKSISGSWKANTGSTMLEQIPLQERWRAWLDECSRIFGGLDVFAIEAVASKEGQEFIISLNDSSSMTLLGETQEEDRQLIAELVYHKMSSEGTNNNRRRSSTLGGPSTNEQRMSQQPLQSIRPNNPPGPAMANGFIGGPNRRGSRESIGSDRDMSDSSGYPSSRPTDRPPMGSYADRDLSGSGRPPPMRDPRDSNIRDVSGSRDFGSARDSQSANWETATKESSVSSAANLANRAALGLDSRPTNVPTTGMSPQMGSQPPNASNTFSGTQFGTTNAQGPPTRQMSRPSMNMSGSMGSGMGDMTGSGGERGSLSGQGNQQPGAMGMGGQPKSTNPGDTDDTMSNLKRTFAGIFGDM
ncbi:hypothetical protein RvY_04944-2 [Ramazzottius varieornatus]|uniref:ATP-grasp domain-containing protein n=1 Tax=Ramazzottius varieornatus TaxID=947166 RepID=A0A1D1UZ35_RAMVA|nr:hypothetical protein RvY_04944-2 [Ramazzottius varieornatus]